MVEEHVPHGHQLLVNLVGVTGEDDSLGNDSLCGRWEICSCADKLLLWGEEQAGHAAPGDRPDEGCHCSLAWVKVAMESVHVIGSSTFLTEEWIDLKTASSTLNHQSSLALDVTDVLCRECDRHIDDGPLMLMAK